jgi:hypothetical protein
MDANRQMQLATATQELCGWLQLWRRSTFMTPSGNRHGLLLLQQRQELPVSRKGDDSGSAALMEADNNSNVREALCRATDGMS